MKELLLLSIVLITSNLFAQTNNYSLQFDGNDDYVNLGNSNTLNPTNGLSLMGAFNISSAPAADDLQCLIGRNSNSLTENYNYNIGIRFPGGLPHVSFSLGQDIVGPNVHILEEEVNYTYGEWAFITGAFSNDSIQVYFNGTLLLDTVITGFGNLHQNSSETYIGKYRSGAPEWYFNGNVDDVHIWNRSLSQQEIQGFMDCPPTGSETGILGYWNFEEGTGTTAGDLTTNNDGTLMNSPIWSTNVPAYNCGVGLEELYQTAKELVMIVDFMGRETKFKPNTPLIFIYSDGTRERVMKIEE